MIILLVFNIESNFFFDKCLYGYCQIDENWFIIEQLIEITIENYMLFLIFEYTKTPIAAKPITIMISPINHS